MKKVTCFLAGLLIFVATRSPCAGQTPEASAPAGLPAQYSATAFGQSGPLAGRSFGLTISVQGLTSDDELNQLETVLRQKGQDGLVNAFGKMKELGRVSPTASVGTGARFVRISPTADGGQRIVLATDRPISFPELWNGTRSTNYKIGIVVLTVDKAGKGTGTFAPLCKVRFNKKDQLEVENYGQKPFRLANVYKLK